MKHYNDVHLSCFRPEMPFLGKFGSKISGSLFKVKFFHMARFINARNVQGVI